MESPIKFSASLKINVVDGKLQKIYEIGSLQDMSALAVGICLYRNWKIHHNAYELILPFTESLQTSILKLPLPSPTKEKLLAVSRSLRTEIILCQHLLHFIKSFIVTKDGWDETMKLIGTKFLILNELVWTCKGITDMKKTAETLVKNESYNLTFRYALACFYCLESWIYELWPVVPNLGLKKMTSKFDLFEYWDQVCESRIKLRNSFDNPYNLKLNFYRAALNDNLAAMEYFLGKLAPEVIKLAIMEIGKIYLKDYIYGESDNHLMSIINDAHSLNLRDLRKKCKEERKSLMVLKRGDVFELVSLLLTNEEKLSLARENIRAALICSLFWDEESKFLQLAKCLYPFARVSDIVFTLNTLLNVQTFDCRYFEKFWLSIPRSLRECISVIKIFRLPNLFCLLCNERDRAKNSLRLFYKFFSENLNEMSEADFCVFKIFLFVSTSSSDELHSLKAILSDGKYFLRKVGETDLNILIKFLNDKFIGTFSELCEVYYDLLKSNLETRNQNNSKVVYCTIN